MYLDLISTPFTRASNFGISILSFGVDRVWAEIKSEKVVKKIKHKIIVKRLILQRIFIGMFNKRLVTSGYCENIIRVI